MNAIAVSSKFPPACYDWNTASFKGDSELERSACFIRQEKIIGIAIYYCQSTERKHCVVTLL